MSGAHRLPNGNTFICNGNAGALTEVTSDGRVVWRYVNPVVEAGPLYQGDVTGGLRLVFRSRRLRPGYPGLAGRDLTPGYPIERYRIPSSGVGESGNTHADAAGFRVSPNPFCGQTTIRLGLLHAASAEGGIYSVDGRLIRALSGNGSQVVWNGADDAGKSVGRGVYYCRFRCPGLSVSKKLVKVD
jgi:hypothetical protein